MSTGGVNVVFRNFSDLGENNSYFSKTGSRYSNHEPNPYLYIPHFEVYNAQMPSIVAIIESKKRIYLDQKLLTNKNSNGKENNQSKLPSVLEEKVLLDLGVEPLRRIVNEMRRISSENIPYNFDNKAGKAAGLMHYCSYLTGEETKSNSKAKVTKSKTYSKPTSSSSSKTNKPKSTNKKRI